MPGKGNNRDRIRDPREEILLETNFEDDGGVLTRAYNGNPYNPSIQNRRRNSYRSDHSLDRYTERGGEGTIPISGYFRSRNCIPIVQ